MDTPDFDKMIESLVRELWPVARGAPSAWQERAVTTTIPGTLRDLGATPEAVVAWARDHRRWRFAVAEAQDEACANPLETAVLVIRTILEERFDELADQG